MHFTKLFFLFLIPVCLFVNSASGAGKELAYKVELMAEKNLVIAHKLKETTEKISLLLAEITNENNGRKMNSEDSLLMHDCIMEMEIIMDEIGPMLYFYELIKLNAIRGVSSNEHLLWYVNLKAEYSDNEDLLEYLATGEEALSLFLKNL